MTANSKKFKNGSKIWARCEAQGCTEQGTCKVSAAAHAQVPNKLPHTHLACSASGLRLQLGIRLSGQGGI